jgi:hypothetical protein
VQVAYAAADVHTMVNRWVADGIGPFFLREHIALRNVRIRGVPSTFDHTSAFAWWGNVMVELIHQHVDDRDHEAEPIVPEPIVPEPIVGDSGVHHMAFFVDDFRVASGELVATGRPELLYAEAGSMPFAFHDAWAERSHHIEIYERTGSLGRFYDMVRSASLGWDGSDPVRVL